MSATAIVKLYLVSLVTCFGLDLLWLGVIAQKFYQHQLSSLLRPDIRWGAAIAFYMLFVVGLMVFVIVPALDRGSLVRALWSGAFFGLVAYATYDLTSLALVRDFPTRVAVVDMAWGATVAALVSAAGYGAGRWLAST
ncbi:MAG: DUF2177 family protein [Gemmatimonadales bacterium]